MLRLLLVSFIVLQLPQVVAAAEIRLRDADERLRIAQPRVQVVDNEIQLRQFCGVNRPIDACTRFVAYRLSASCTGDRSQWSVTASAGFTPWIILLKPGAMTHELLHIGDIRDASAEYLQELESNNFSSWASCEDATLREMNGFAQKLADFAKASNARRHPEHRHRSE